MQCRAISKTLFAWAQVPLAVIGGHKKAVSYVRWMDGSRLISASTDNQLKLWDINSAAAAGTHQDRKPINVLSGMASCRFSTLAPGAGGSYSSSTSAGRLLAVWHVDASKLGVPLKAPPKHPNIGHPALGAGPVPPRR